MYIFVEEHGYEKSKIINTNGSAEIYVVSSLDDPPCSVKILYPGLDGPITIAKKLEQREAEETLDKILKNLVNGVPAISVSVEYDGSVLVTPLTGKD